MKQFIFRCPYLPLSLALLGVRSKNDGVFGIIPFNYNVVPGGSGVPPEPMGGCKGGTCGERSLL